MTDESSSTPAREPYPSIGDYALIGNCRSAALISRAGSLDWFCAPRFDSPALFAALLDRETGGRFGICPVDVERVERRYVSETNVLCTTFETSSGVVRVTDLMPVAADAVKGRRLWPEHEVLREVECLEGKVLLEVVYAPRPDFGRVRPRLEQRGAVGIAWQGRQGMLVLRSDVPLSIERDGATASARVGLEAGERRWLSLVFAGSEPAVLPTLGSDAEQRLRQTIDWWQQWCDRCRYDGAYRHQVIRSALALKLLSYAPSGAIVAAATSSLPECIGGQSNWDYRYCWLRDASMTLEALLDLGYREEGQAFLSWLLYSTRLSAPDLQVVYDVHGETNLKEKELHHFDGHAGSKPVRIGNSASTQFQLDTYGEVVHAVYEWVQRGGTLDGTAARFVRGLAETVCRRWREPDNGLWESRGERRHFTTSKVMCWVALDRYLQLVRRGAVEGPEEPMAQELEAIRNAIEEHGYDTEARSYVRTFGGKALDASLLLLSKYEYAAADSPRMTSTRDCIAERLGCRDGLMYRYLANDGRAPSEGAFVACSFWMVASLARAGRVDEAHEIFERMLEHCNDVGLLAEEVSVETGEALGNFPQGFSHVGLIDAALVLHECAGAEARGAPMDGGRIGEAAE